MCVRVESNPSCHPGSAVARPSTSTSSGGKKKEKRVGDKKARVPLSPILIPNHSQHKAPRPRMSTAPPAGRIARHPRGVKLPTCPPRYRRLRQEAIVGGGEGGAGRAGGLTPGATHSLPADKGSGGDGSAAAAAYHATTAAGYRLINKKVSAAGK